MLAAMTVSPLRGFLVTGRTQHCKVNGVYSAESGINLPTVQGLGIDHVSVLLWRVTLTHDQGVIS